MRSRLPSSACSMILVVLVVLAGAGATAHPAPGVVTGTVFGAGGIPLAGATVYLLADSALVGSVTTDGAGVFEFADLPSGEYVLVADAAEHKPLAVDVLLPEEQAWARDLFLTPGQGEPYVEGPNEWRGFIACGAAGVSLCQFDPNDSRRLFLDVGRGIRTITATLEWEAGNPTADVLELEVRAGPEMLSHVSGSSPLELRIDLGERDDAGWLLEFRVVLPSGAHVFHQQPFTLRHTLHYWQPAPQHVMQDADIHVEAPGAVSGVVFSEEIEPIPDAAVYLLAAGSLHGAAHTAMNGQYALHDVVPEHYVLVAAAAGHGAAAALVLVSADTVTVHNFLLVTAPPTPEPYVTHDEAIGFVACDVGWPLWIQCGPLDPNQQSRIVMDIDQGVRTIDLRLDWEPNVGLGLAEDSLSVEVQLLATGAGMVILDQKTGPPPLVFRFTDAEFDFAQYDESDVALAVRVDAPFGTVVYQQPFDVEATIYHWASAP